MSLSTIVFILTVISAATFGFAMSNLSDNKMKLASRLMIVSYICLLAIIDIMLFKLNIF